MKALEKLNRLHNVKNLHPEEFFEANDKGILIFKPVLLARRLTRELQIIFNYRTGFYFWNDSHWEEIHQDQIERCLLMLLGMESTKGRCIRSLNALKIMCSVGKKHSRKQICQIADLIKFLHHAEIEEILFIQPGLKSLFESLFGNVNDGNCSK